MKETVEPKGEWLTCSQASEEYHYGAAYEIRWIPDQVGGPGQQCTYDQTGDLITGGIAAGSPDLVSPRACGLGLRALLNTKYILRHKKADVDPWEEQSCLRYLEAWPSNNANRCSSNPVTAIAHLRSLVENLTCREIVALFKGVDERSGHEDKLVSFFRGETNLAPEEQKALMQSFADNIDCDKKRNTGVCISIEKALKSSLIK